jgi:hypothetical protein
MIAEMAPRTTPLRTVVLGDLHGSLDAFRTILTRAGLLEDDSWRGGRTILVQTGDVIDRGPDSIATYEFLADLQVRARKGKGKVVRLVGNHEVALLEGYFDMADFPEPERLAERIRQDVLEGRVQAAFAHAGWLFSHAGVHYNLLQRLRTEMQGNGETRKRFTPRRLAAHLNGRFKTAVATGDFADPIFAVGHARGGDDPTGGIFWADYDEELEAPARAPRFHQVFGHTPEGYTGARFRRTSDFRRINIDIGIAENYGGNLGYLEIRGREAIAHYLTDGGEETESLGSAPLAHPPRPRPPAEAPPEKPAEKESEAKGE